MDLLLQAAQVLELENAAVGGGDFVSSKSTRGSYFLQQPKTKTEANDRLDISHLYGDNGVSTGDEDTPATERTSRRVGGIGTREVHNQLEKNRRKQLREFFTHLQQCVPSLENKRVATQSILQGAIKHIKNLKKKDVEQEREIQMLAKRKSELKKKFDYEFNKCTEEQQRTAQVLLSVVGSNLHVVTDAQDGHTSDSTSTASEGPCSDDYSDGEQDVIQPSSKTHLSPVNSDGRKRKLISRAGPAQGARVSEPSSGSSRSGSYARSLVPSSVSSSSLALKHMLEQRKRNQTATCQAVSTASQTRGVHLMPASAPQAAQMSGAATRSPGRLTYSYPMITTHLASAVKPALSASDRGATTTPLLPQTTVVADGSVSVKNNHTSPSPGLHSEASTMTSTSANAARKVKRAVLTKPKDGVSGFHQALTPHNAPLSTHKMMSSGSPLKVTQIPTAPFPAFTLLQTQAAAAEATEMRKVDNPFTSAQKVVATVSGIDVQSLNCLGKTVIGSQAGAMTLEPAAPVTQSLNLNIQSPKLLPTVIPLASIMRGLPLSTSLNHLVTLSPSPFTLSTTDSSPVTSVGVPSILNNKLQFSQGTNFLLRAAPATTQQNSLSLPTNNTRITTLLAAPSTHINSSANKPTSPNNSTTSSICPSPINIPVTLAPTLVPISLTTGPVPSSASTVISPGTPLRIFAPMSQAPMVANGQSSLMPTVVQLETSGQMSLLQNLISAQHVHVQNQHHILAQPIVVMATAGSNFVPPSSTVTTSSSVS